MICATNVKCACSVTGEGHQLLIDFKAYKEKLLHEELVIADSNNPAATLTLVFHARVLGMFTMYTGIYVYTDNGRLHFLT